MKILSLLGLSMACVLLMGTSSCEQKLDDLGGVHPVYDANGNLVKNPDGTPKIIIDEDSPAAKALARTGNSTGPLGIILTGIGGLFLTGAQEVLKRRMQDRLMKEEAAHAATKVAHEETKVELGQAITTINATTGGLVSFARANPTMAPALVDHIDHSHDVHDVSAEHQDAIQSALAPPRIAA